jgi:hypothetical protein
MSRRPGRVRDRLVVAVKMTRTGVGIDPLGGIIDVMTERRVAPS